MMLGAGDDAFRFRCPSPTPTTASRCLWSRARPTARSWPCRCRPSCGRGCATAGPLAGLDLGAALRLQLPRLLPRPARPLLPRHRIPRSYCSCCCFVLVLVLVLVLAILLVLSSSRRRLRDRRRRCLPLAPLPASASAAAPAGSSSSSRVGVGPRPSRRWPDWSSVHTVDRYESSKTQDSFKRPRRRTCTLICKDGQYRRFTASRPWWRRR